MSPLRIPRAIAAATLALATLAMPAAGDELDEVLAEIDAVPQSAIAANPQGWAEVLALLEAYIAEVTGAPANGLSRMEPSAAGMPTTATLDATADARIARHFAALVAAQRQVPDVDPAAALLGRGLRGGAGGGRPAAAGAPAAGPLADLANTLGPQASALAIDPLLALARPAEAGLLLRRVEALTSSPHATTSHQGIREAFDQLRARAERQSHDLLQVRDAGAAMAQRLAGLTSVVARGAAIDVADARSAASQLAGLRSELAALQSSQQASLARLAGPERFGGAGLVRDTQAPGLLR